MIFEMGGDIMIEARLTLANEVGLHARPAAMLVKCAARYKCQVAVKCGNKTANAKSIMSVLTLGAVYGDELVVTAEGIDEAECIEAIRELAERNFIEA